MIWDVFLSHAHEDKPFARRLARSLIDSGLRVWFDEFTLETGDSLRRSIDTGLRESRYGIVILSPSFFRKEWPQRELDGLTAREDGKSKVLLPVWYNVSADDVRKYSPPLADKLSIYYAGSVKGVVSKLLRSIHKDQIGELGWQPVFVEVGEDLPAAVLPARPSSGMALCAGRFPITNEVYARFVRSTKHREPVGEHFISDDWRGPYRPWLESDFSASNKPVVCVDFWDALEFCRWASSIDARTKIFLPSAELWDFIATNGHLGLSLRSALRTTAKELIHHKAMVPAPIDFSGRRDNTLGVSDMFGNVWEWCGGNRYEQDFPHIAVLGGNRVRPMEAELRGGSFLDDLDVIHPALRSGVLEDGTHTRHTDLGFRICATVDLERLNPGVAASLDAMPALPESVWATADALSYYNEALYMEHRQRIYEEGNDA